jgi:addiction module HigA family antidote
MKTKTFLINPIPLLLEDALLDYKLTRGALAKALGIPSSRLSELLHGKLRVNAELALRLSIVFKTSAEMWLGLQSEYDLRKARKTAEKRLKKLLPLAA